VERRERQMSDPWRLDGRVALVTGAGRGLSRGCSLELAHAGARVVLVSRTATELEQVAAEADNDAVALVADVTDEHEVRRIVREAAALGELAVLVTAAGTNHPGAARDYPVSWVSRISVVWRLGVMGRHQYWEWGRADAARCVWRSGPPGLSLRL
jgi:NAD(P)-dependent dehydrogenase (short-subunit alcohol dehydrogenase family)